MIDKTDRQGYRVQGTVVIDYKNISVDRTVTGKLVRGPIFHGILVPGPIFSRKLIPC